MRRFAITVVLALAACAGPRRQGAAPAPPSRSLRVALLPGENLAAVPVPLRRIEGRVHNALVGAGLEVVSGERIEVFLERHRLWYTAGVDEASAAAAHDELGVDAVVLWSIEAYEGGHVPRLAITMRAVTASSDARVIWIDAAARKGDDAPGLFGFGLVHRFEELEDRELARLARSLVRAMSGAAPPAEPCVSQRRFRPRIEYRSPRFDRSRSYSVAVLPFINETLRRRAGEVLALELARQFAAADRITIVEPGVVRDRLVRNRVVMEGGISVDMARQVLEALKADLVVTGYVRDYVDGADPTVNFTILALEREHGTVMWESTSHGTGSDGVWLLGLGQVSTAPDLTCRLARNVVKGFIGDEVARPRSTQPAAGGPR